MKAAYVTIRTYVHLTCTVRLEAGRIAIGIGQRAGQRRRVVSARAMNS